ncbi:hypothetical protein H0H93_011482 [Arthromyces matolae]|nr:hypothetical protein H0H93_011482 [Arthromyces matolae]
MVAEWSRFLAHSSYVRAIEKIYVYDTDSEGFVVTPGTYTAVQQSIATNCIPFPSIIEIDFHLSFIEDPCTEIMLAQLFSDYEVLAAGRKVDKVFINQTGYISIIQQGADISNLAALATRSSSFLTTISISGNMSWDFIDMLAGQQSLRFLDLDFLAIFPRSRRLSMRGLLQLRSVITLLIALPEEVSFEESQSGQLDSLSQLTIQASNIAGFRALCSIAPNVTALALLKSSDFPEDIEEWQEFFRQLSRKCRSLTKFEASNNLLVSTHPLKLYVYIEPLLSLPLKHLILTSSILSTPGCFLLLTDEEVQEIGSRLSQLKTVEISIDAPYVEPVPTSKGLFALIRTCLLLQSVVMVIDGREIILGRNTT